MSDNTLKSLSGGIIQVLHPNQYYTALTGNHVPRNSNGVPTDLGGSLGDSTRRWDSGYFRDVFVGASASGISLSESGGDLVIKVGSAEKTRITDSHLTVNLLGGDPGTNGVAVTTDASTSTSSATYVDLTGLSNTLSISGRPVEIVLISHSSLNSFIELRTSGTAVSDMTADIKLVRDATDVEEISLGIRNDDVTGSDDHSIAVPPSAVRFIDHGNAAGSYTWKLQGKVSDANATLEIIGRLMLREYL